jgi:hypothetical protein
MILAPLTAASLLVLAASPQNLCTMPKPTDIEIVPSSKSVHYDYSKGLDDLQGLKMDTISPHNFNGISVTQGFMNGSIQLVPKVELSYQTYKGFDAACVWYDKITITLQLDPTIVIAREVQADPCMNTAVTAHEKKHVKVDRQIVNKYSQIMGEEIYAALEDRGFIAGPVKTASLDALVERMQKVVFQIVEHQYKKMDLERIELQQKVDSREEYQRISDQCPDFNPPQYQQQGQR